MLTNYNKYLTASEVEKMWDFYITTVGYNKTDINGEYPNNREHPTDHIFTWNKGRMLDGYYIVFISKGQGIFESAQTETCSIKAGTCFFLFPGVWHRYKPDPSSGWEEYWIGFKGGYPEELINKGIFDAAKPFIEVGLHDDLLALFHSALQVVQSGKARYNDLLPGITLQILGLVHSVSQEKQLNENETGKLISKAKFLLQDYLEVAVSMEEIAKELPMSYSNFRKAFKETTGESPNQYLINLRLKKAKELFTNTTLSISEIAYKTGFDSVFYFSKLFKKKNGISPKFYRVGS